MSKNKSFDYHEEALFYAHYSNTLICNWSRGLGKSFTIFKIIFEFKPENVLIVNNNNFEERYRDILNSEPLAKLIKAISYTKEKITVCFLDGKITKVWNFKYLSNCNIFDIVFFDDMLPVMLNNILTNKTISFITLNNSDHHIEKIFNTAKILNHDYTFGLKNGLFNQEMIKKFKTSEKHWLNQFAILDNPSTTNIEQEFIIWKEKYDIPYHVEFHIKTLLKLQKEYEDVEIGSHTTKTRETLLGMINRLQGSLVLKPKNN